MGFFDNFDLGALGKIGEQIQNLRDAVAWVEIADYVRRHPDIAAEMTDLIDTHREERRHKTATGDG